MENYEGSTIIPTDYETASGTEYEVTAEGVAASPETRGVAVKRKTNMKDILFRRY